jgi:ABC-type multidrug transport system fused ATPase/permease subunit
MNIFSSVSKSWKLLSRKEQTIVKLVSIIQVLLNFLDLVGIGMIATLGALSIQTLESETMGNRVGTIIYFLNLENLSFPNQISILGLITSIIFVSKTIVSALLMRFIYFFFSRKGTEISSELISKIMNRNFNTKVLNTNSKKDVNQTSQEILYAATTGVNTLMTGILATSINILADISLFLILILGLFYIDPEVSVILVLIFVTIGFMLYKLINKRAGSLGAKSSYLTILNNNKILEILNSHKEIKVRGREKYYIDSLTDSRRKLGDVNAELAFQPLISKYVIELVSIFGILSLAVAQLASKDLVYGIAILGTFIAAISRITPSILRIQQGFISLKANTGIAGNTLVLIDSLKSFKERMPICKEINFHYDNFVPSIKLHDVYFSYGDSEHFALEAINLQILPGELVALVGPTGAGKTTLAELILGLNHPNQGVVEISGVSPEDAISEWPGSIAYVPQQVYISQGTLMENICLGFDKDLVSIDHILKCIELSQLHNTVLNLPKGLNTDLGEHGSKISGGERQRIGIARALFTRPKILVLDESTSSLDSQTERDLSNSIISLRNESTVLIIAHRLSTVKSADKVVYLENGRVLFIGTFEQVKNNIPDFAIQASLMGL